MEQNNLEYLPQLTPYYKPHQKAILQYSVLYMHILILKNILAIMREFEDFYDIE